MRLPSRIGRKNSGNMKRCANAFSGAHPLRPLVPPRLAVRHLLGKAKTAQERAEAEEKDVAGEEIIAKREILRRPLASLDTTSTIHLQARPNQMHILDRKVAELSLKGMVPTLKLHSNHYEILGALTQVEEVASISIAVPE